MIVGIIDYGMGNLKSVSNAFQLLGADTCIVHKPENLKLTDYIVLPGVGAFTEGMRNLRAGNWIEAITDEALRKGKPFLGICLGMQLLSTFGMEHERCEGLNLIPGTVEQIRSNHNGFRLPHIGWNDISVREGSKFYEVLEDGKDFYFVHSYVFMPSDPSVINGVCDYFGEFTASVEKDNIFGTQYHPEKSQKVGLKVLNNFLNIKGC
ncbi:imidazole glycerol phosphate synthase subunit HisH [Desulfosporosinus fructosivorans]